MTAYVSIRFHASLTEKGLRLRDIRDGLMLTTIHHLLLDLSRGAGPNGRCSGRNHFIF